MQSSMKCGGRIGLILIACVANMIGGRFAFGFQTDAIAIEKVRQAMNRIASIANISLEGRYSSKVQKLEKLRFERLGSRWCLEGDVKSAQRNTISETHKNQLQRIRELLGSDLQGTIFFDGQFTYEYQPASLRVEISNFDLGSEREYIRPFDPVFWLTPFPGLPLPSVLTNENFSKSAEGFCSIHLKLQPSVEGIRTAYKDLIIKFDEAQGWNWTEIEMTGGAVGQYKQIREWKLHDRHWYGFRGSTEREHETIETWEVIDITFDPRKVVSAFKFEESAFPIGIEIKDALPGEVKPKRFVGGAEGERQNRLLRAAESLGRAIKVKDE